MDVNGFMLKVKRVMVEDNPGVNRFNIKTITFESLGREFSTHKSWINLTNPDSQFTQFLKNTMLDEANPDLIDVSKLRMLGVLWCNGEPLEKANELYDILQDNDQERIAASDKDFKPNLFLLFDFATKMVFEQEAEFMKKDRKILAEEVEEKREQYDDLAEDFLDNVFDTEGVLPRLQWEETVAEKVAYIFDPEQIRQNLGYNY